MALPRAKYLSNESTGNRKKSLDGDVVEIVGGAIWYHLVGSASPTIVSRIEAGVSMVSRRK